MALDSASSLFFSRDWFFFFLSPDCKVCATEAQKIHRSTIVTMELTTMGRTILVNIDNVDNIEDSDDGDDDANDDGGLRGGRHIEREGTHKQGLTTPLIFFLRGFLRK